MNPLIRFMNPAVNGGEKGAASLARHCASIIAYFSSYLGRCSEAPSHATPQVTPPDQKHLENSDRQTNGNP